MPEARGKLPVDTGGAVDAANPLRVRIGPFVRIHRTASFAVKLQLLLRRPTFSVLPEKAGKKRRWMRIGLYRKPQKNPVEKHCGQHTGISLQS